MSGNDSGNGRTNYHYLDRNIMGGRAYFNIEAPYNRDPKYERTCEDYRESVPKQTIFGKLLNPHEPRGTDIDEFDARSEIEPLIPPANPAELQPGSVLAQYVEQVRPILRGDSDDSSAGASPESLSRDDTGDSLGFRSASAQNAASGEGSRTHDLKLEFSNPSQGVRPFPKEPARELNSAVRDRWPCLWQVDPWPEPLITVARVARADLRASIASFRQASVSFEELDTLLLTNYKVWLHQAQFMHDIILNDQIRQTAVADSKTKCILCKQKFSKQEIAVLFHCSDNRFFHRDCARTRLKEALTGIKNCPLCGVPIVEYSVAAGLMRSGTLPLTEGTLPE